MKKLIFILLAFSGLWAKSLSFGGYAENVTSLMLADTAAFSDVAKIRLEGEWDYGKKGGIETHVIIGHALQPLDPFANLRKGSLMEGLFGEYIGGMMAQFTADMDSAEQAMIAPLLEQDYGSALDYLPYSSLYPAGSVTLDRALIKLYFKRADLYIGRQMIAWGTGYGFNPTDVWNTKNPLDPTAPKAGVNAVRVEIPYGSVSGISLVAVPGPDIKHSSAGIRFKQNVAGYDISFSVIRISNADREIYGLRPLFMAGLDMAGQLGDVGVWFEGAGINRLYKDVDFTNTDAAYVQLDIGLDYTFTNGLYLMGEYYYNDLGKQRWQGYSAMDLIPLMGGDMAGLGQHYLMAGINYSVGNDWQLSLFSLGNLTDQSAMILPSVEYLFSENISLKVTGQLGSGDKAESEYGSVYNTVMLQTTGYF